MAASPRVQLSLKGRLLSEVPFSGEQLRIGRMRENDVVVNNLAVSRFHAVLKRAGDGFVVEDLGSENGTLLNGARVEGSAPLTANDTLTLGKYELRIVMQDGPAAAAAPAKRSSDVWDASQTFLADAPPAAKPASAPPPPAPVAAPAPAPVVSSAPAPELPLLDVAPSVPADPDGLFAFGEDDLAGSAEPAPAAAEVLTDPLVGRGPEHTSLFDFGDAAGAISQTAGVVASAPAPIQPSSPADAPPPLHAGLIVSRDGKLHSLRPWDGSELCAGRSPECDLVLADAGISRRHAVFARGATGYEVRDLGSVNGFTVNGQRAKQHTLKSGDVIRIESFELTFVLDQQPVGSEVSAPTPASSSPQDGGHATRFSLDLPEGGDEEFALAPLAGDPNEVPPEGDTDAASAEALPELEGELVALAPEEPALADDLGSALPEADLLHADDLDDAEKELELELQAAEPPRAAAIRALTLRLRLDGADLSPRACEALAVLAEEGVVLTARMEFAREE